ncbi:MAG: hypothetical protein ACREDN_10865, partial [Aestuariivirga sp.]
MAVDRILRDGSEEKIEAEPSELKALAARLAVPVLHAFSAELRAVPWRGGLKLEGRIKADIEQVSVVSLEAFRQRLEFPVTRYFLPAGAVPEDSEETDAIDDGHV